MKQDQEKRTRAFWHTTTINKMNYSWGVWYFDEERLGLQHKNGTYFIDLKRLNTPLEILGTLAHLCQNGKDQAYGPTAHGDLLKAINEIFYLEEHMVGFKPLKDFDTEKLLKAYVCQYHKEQPKSKLHRNRWKKEGVCKYVRYTIPFDKAPKAKQPCWDKELNREWFAYMKQQEEVIYVQ